MVLEPQSKLTVNTNIQEIHHYYHVHHHHHTCIERSEHHDTQSNSQATMSDFLENKSQEHLFHHHSYNEGHDDHTLSAEDLALKLHKVQQERERDDYFSHGTDHGTGYGTPMVQIDAGLQKRVQETIQEILERLERQKNEGDLQFQATVVPGMEDNRNGRIRHTHRLNPNLLARDSNHTHTLTQSHGNANLRHS